MINNNENISNLTNINPLCNSANNIILLNKKNKIYENHLYENKKKKENKNRDEKNIIKIKKNNNIKTNKTAKKKVSEPQKFQEEIYHLLIIHNYLT
jgi:succinyl-CoA synthetase beta subunit